MWQGVGAETTVLNLIGFNDWHLDKKGSKQQVDVCMVVFDVCVFVWFCVCMFVICCSMFDV